MRYGSFFIAIGLQVGAIGLGFYWGVGNDYVGRPPSVYTDLAVFAGLFMLGGVCLSLAFKNVNGAKHRTQVCIGSLAYSVGVVVFEPFSLFPEIGEMVLAALVLAPLLAAIGYVVRAKAWLSVIGVTLFVFTSSAMIATNSYTIYRKSGFFQLIEVRE